jgi:hypothetical protein
MSKVVRRLGVAYMMRKPLGMARRCICKSVEPCGFLHECGERSKRGQPNSQLQHSKGIFP